MVKSGLYLVATPIGNLDDITLRALQVLNSSDIIFCENSKNSLKLLQKYNINTKLKVYTDHSYSILHKLIMEYLDQGKILSLISDAGSPLISDPGYKLVKELVNNNYNVDVVPGACSPIVALMLSTMPTDRFMFAGFVPKTKPAKIKLFNEFKELKATLIFFETANRLSDTIECAIEALGNRFACVARELTKLYQEVQIKSLVELKNYYSTNPIKGEVIILIDRNDVSEISDLDNVKEQIVLLLSQGMSKKDIVGYIHKYHKNINRKEIYKMVHEK